MKLLVVLALVAVAAAAPQQRVKRQGLFGGLGGGVGALAKLLRSESTNDGSGNYRYSYEQSDGRKQEEQGELRNRGTPNEAIAVKGSYSWVGPDGVTYDVNYTADEDGYQPEIEQGPGGGIPPSIIATLAG